MNLMYFKIICNLVSGIIRICSSYEKFTNEVDIRTRIANVDSERSVVVELCHVQLNKYY